MMSRKKTIVYILSDSVGDTAELVVAAAEYDSGVELRVFLSAIAV